MSSDLTTTLKPVNVPANANIAAFTATFEGQYAVTAAAFPLLTARLSISPCNEAAAAVLELVLADPRVSIPFHAGRPAPARHDVPLPLLTLAAYATDDGALVGSVRLGPDHFSYFVDPACWGRGFGSEMAAACCSLAPLLGIRILRTTVVRENAASRNILEKAGFVFNGMSTYSRSRSEGKIVLLSYSLRTGA
jgi:GNAT superfamily N-acetyltransferase